MATQSQQSTDTLFMDNQKQTRQKQTILHYISQVYQIR